MRRRYEISYYEYGMTQRQTRRFFTTLGAIIYGLIIRRRYGDEAYIVIREN